MFTKHGLERIEEGRLEMSSEKIIEIINSDKVVLLGKEAGTNRVHKLFYSEVDNDYFVVVQDEKTGEIITILPIHYHNRWEISEYSLMMAKHIRGFAPEPQQPLERQSRRSKSNSSSRPTLELAENSNSYDHRRLTFECEFINLSYDCRVVKILDVIVDYDSSEGSLYEEIPTNQEVVDTLRNCVQKVRQGDEEVISLNMYIGKRKIRCTSLNIDILNSP